MKHLTSCVGAAVSFVYFIFICTIQSAIKDNKGKSCAKKL